MLNCESFWMKHILTTLCKMKGHAGGWPTEGSELSLRPGVGQEVEDERGRGGGWRFTSSVSAVRRVDHTNSMMATKTAMMRPQIRTTKIPPMFSMPRPETQEQRWNWMFATCWEDRVHKNHTATDFFIEEKKRILIEDFPCSIFLFVSTWGTEEQRLTSINTLNPV